MSLRLVNWNVEWAKPESPRGAEVLRRVHGHVPEFVCLTHPMRASDAPCCGPIQPASRFYSGDLKSDMRLPAIS